MTPRRIKQRLERLPFVLSLSAGFSDWRTRQWLRRHPDRTFADYYIAVNEARISAGRPHPTLGGPATPRGTSAPSHGQEAPFASGVANSG